MEKQEILDQLNGYTGDNIWEDLIKGLPGYDETTTNEVDPSYSSDRFVVAGTTYRYDRASQSWYEIES